MKHRRPVRMIFAAAMAAFMALGMSPAVYAGGSEISVSENGGIPAEQKLLQPAEESSLTEDGTSSEDSSAAEDGILVFACDGNGEYHLYKAPDFQSVKDKSYTEIVTPEGASINGNVLKLSGFHYETSAKVALYIAADFAGIRLSGSNSIVCSSQSTGTEESIFCRTLESEKDLMIFGSGSLSLQAPAFDVTNDVTGYISSEALYAKGDLRVTENAAVEAKAGDISLKGSGYDDYGNAKALYVMSTGILCEGNMDVQRSAGITADAGKTNAESTAGTEENVLCEAQSAAIISYGSLSITDKAWIAATAQDSKRKGEASVRPPYGGSFGIMSEGNMTMSGKSLTAASGCTNEVSSIGINVCKDLNLNSGLVRTTADTAADSMEDEGSCGMYIEEKLTCNSADVFAMGADNGVIASDITAVVGTAKGCTEAGRGWDAADEAVTVSLVNEKYGRYSFVTGDGHARTLVIRGMVTAGDNRYETAVNTANEVFPDGSSTVVLAAGANWPDALAASALAGANHCPILLTGRDYVTTETSDEIITLGVSKVFIVGGEDAMTRAVPEVLQDIGISEENIIRKSGDDRTQTADAVAAEVMQTGTSDTCFICSGNNFPDALSIASYANRHSTPILLTQGNGTLSSASLTMAKGFAKIYIIGGTAAVSKDVEGQLSSAGAAVPVRLFGNDRYATSVAVVNEFYPEGLDLLTMVSGENFPDALTAAVSLRDCDCTILLINGRNGSLTKDQISIIQSLRTIDGAATVGGEGALSKATRAVIDDAAVSDPLAQMSAIYSGMMERKTTAEPVLRTVDEFPGLICGKCSFISYQGTKLAGYKYSREGIVPKGVIIMAHGLGPGGQCVYMDQADYFTRNGYLVFAYDATRNDGSAGDSCIGIQQGVLDLDKAISYVEQDSVMKSLPIGLYGHSWGAYCVSAVLKLHPEVKAVAEISGFNESQNLLETLFGRSLVPYYSWYVEWKLFGSYAFLTGMEGFEKTDADIMVIHSEDDQNVPISTGYDLYYDKYKDNSRFTFEKYTDRGHLYIFYTDAARKYDEAYAAAEAAYFQEKGLQNTTENRDAYYADHPFDKKTGFELDTTFMGNILAFFDKNIGG